MISLDSNRILELWFYQAEEVVVMVEVIHGVGVVVTTQVEMISNPIKVILNLARVTFRLMVGFITMLFQVGLRQRQ